MRGWGLSIRLDIRLITGGVEYSQKLKKKIYSHATSNNVSSHATDIERTLGLHPDTHITPGSTEPLSSVFIT